jgi:phage tail-like protein
MADAHDAQPSYRFYVVMSNVPQAIFTEVSGLQIETEVLEYQEGGNNGFVHRRPGRVKVGNLTLKRGMTKSNEFFKWCIAIAQGKIERHNISLVMYDVTGAELVRWEFVNAYPVKWSGPQFTADGSAAAIETLELTHEGVQLS